MQLVPSGNYRKMRLSSEFNLGLEGGSEPCGNDMCLWPKNSAHSQLWKFE